MSYLTNNLMETKYPTYSPKRSLQSACKLKHIIPTVIDYDNFKKMWTVVAYNLLHDEKITFSGGPSFSNVLMQIRTLEL